MGIARLLAKGWIAICLFAGAETLSRSLIGGVPPAIALAAASMPVLLFGAMGVLFIAGYGLSSGHLAARFRPTHFVPGFNEIVFIIFAVLSLVMQFAPHPPSWRILNALQDAIGFGVPGERALEQSLARCSLDGGRAFSAAASWLLALIFLGSALSRVSMSAALVRLERKRRIAPLGASGTALVLGLAAVAGIQVLFMGSLFRVLSCQSLVGILGGMLTGLAPLMLGYLIFAAITSLLAINPES
jgi:hypothetical protein